MDLQEKVNVFLDELAKSNELHKFGTAANIAFQFNISKDEARKLLLNWMQPKSLNVSGEQ
jgi:hypothetical protein